jgi:hypothetical protein
MLAILITTTTIKTTSLLFPSKLG